MQDDAERMVVGGGGGSGWPGSECRSLERDRLNWVSGGVYPGLGQSSS